jgi:16S rRNA (guanine966-N2)-methyltransferase
MRVTGGAVRGRIIKVPKGFAVRPTPDMMRQAMFNSLGASVCGTRVLELFAGSGALSLECMSRGAVSSTCVEKSRYHATILRSNWESCGFKCQSLALRVQDAYAALGQLAALGEQFDLVLADPPYGEKNQDVRSQSFAQKLLDTPSLKQLLSQDGTFILGHPCRETLTVELPWKEVKKLRHGDNVMRFFKLLDEEKKSDEEDGTAIE